MNWKLSFLALFFILGGVTAFNKPFARLWEYSAFGVQNTTKKGNSANLFFGLPYAKQPERFEKAKSLKPSLLKVVNANKWPLACHQVVDVAPLGFTVTEDCLKFNVFAPTTPSLKLRPVFIFIHGGGYEYGFTEEYGWEYLVDNFVTRDIIMVTLQYRLAHYGFLATEDGEINGNFGHFDQIEALKFIKRNILAFGGDPNRITLSGHSAGSISVHTLSLSPKTHGLYNQEIHIASSNYAQWPINSKFVFEHSLLISNAVGCPQTNTKQRKACLKNVNPQKFWDVRTQLNLTDFPYETRDVLYWTTVYDNDLFEGKKIDELQAIAPKRNILYGLDAGEGLVWSIHTDNIITNVFSVGRGFAPADRHLATADTIKDRLLRQLMATNTTVFTPAVQEEVFQKVFDFYNIGPEHAASNPLHYWEKYSEIFTDTMMKIPTNLEINAKIDAGFKNQYMFLFNYTRPQDRPVIGNLPGHGYFLMYFAGLEIYTTFGINETATDLAVQDNLAQMFENFVKSGTPQANQISAPKITSKAVLPYMEFTSGVVIGDVDFTPKTQFWHNLGQEYHYDIIRDVPL